MPQLIKTIQLVALLFLMGLPLHAQDGVKLTASASKTKVALNGRIRVEFTINKQGGDDFKAPNFTNFRVISGPMSSINSSWINGKMSYKMSYIYTISPTKMGDLTLGAAQIEYDDQVLKSNRLKIQVVDEEELPADPNDPNYYAKENVHLVTRVSNKSPYVGEGIYVEYRLYFSENIGLRDFAPTNVPNYNGFWNEEIEIKNTQLKRGQFNGEQYRYVVLKKAVLIPQRTGKLIIDNMGMDIALQVPTNRADFFGNRIMNNLTRNFETGKKVVTVKSLPEAGKPANFAGAVGDFDLIMKSNKTKLKSNESVLVELGVSGKGNLKLFELPKLVTPSELEVYTPEHFEKVKTNSGGMSGRIYDAYTIVPQKGGNYKLPKIDFAYFNPADKKYYELHSEDLFLEVSQGTSVGAVAGANGTSVDKQQVNTAQNSFQYIATKTKLSQGISEAFFGSWKFYLLLLLPMIAIPIGIGFGNAREARSKDVAGNKKRRADRLARKYLSEAKKKIKDTEEFYMALERALHNYLKAKLAVETVDISKDNIRELLLGRGVDASTIDTFISVFDHCELARYTPITDVMMQEEYNRAKEVISEIDKQL